MEAQHEIKLTEANVKICMRSLVLSLIILVVPLHVPLSLYNKGKLVNFYLSFQFSLFL